MTNKSVHLLAVIVLLLSFTSCQPGNGPTTEANNAEPTAAHTHAPQPLKETSTPQSSPTLGPQAPTPVETISPSQGGEVVVGGLGRPDGLNPLLAESDVSRALISLLYDSLLSYDPDSGALRPRLAESWHVAQDGKSITFTLRGDVKWHDDQPLTANDVVFTIEAVRDPTLDTLYGPQLSHVAQAEALDSKTVGVTLNEPHCPSLTALAELPVLPQHLLDGEEISGLPLGSGPFVLSDWTPEGEVHLARNDDYWNGAPYLDALSYRPFETVAELRQALQAGQVDVALLPAEYVYTGPKVDAVAYQYLAPEIFFVAFNNDHPLLGDPRVRRALSMAVDREQLLDQSLGGAGELISGSLLPGHWAADPTLEPPPYDPHAARRLLAEAGWTDSDGDGCLDRDGEPLRLPVRTNGGNRLREDLATLVAGYYRAIGMEARVEIVLWGALVDDMFTHDFEVLVFSWPLRAEADQSLLWLSTENAVGSGYNFVSFADEEVDRLWGEASSLPGCDLEQRADRYQQVQGILAEKRPYDFLLAPYASVLAREGVHGIAAGPFAHPLQSAPDWYVDPAADR